ncbi:MAG: hypothetical protein NTX50_26210 [Candidatus Sumerlaeota bacterium]|nr:hypothetical protein [Candidatus Sumerlaeota bacterium]
MIDRYWAGILQSVMVLLVGFYACGAKIRLQDGQETEGKIVEQNDTRIILEHYGVKTSIPRSRIAAIEQKSAEEESLDHIEHQLNYGNLQDLRTALDIIDRNQLSPAQARQLQRIGTIVAERLFKQRQEAQREIIAQARDQAARVKSSEAIGLLAKAVESHPDYIRCRIELDQMLNKPGAETLAFWLKVMELAEQEAPAQAAADATWFTSQQMKMLDRLRSFAEKHASDSTPLPAQTACYAAGLLAGALPEEQPSPYDEWRWKYRVKLLEGLEKILKGQAAEDAWPDLTVLSLASAWATHWATRNTAMDTLARKMEQTAQARITNEAAFSASAESWESLAKFIAIRHAQATLRLREAKNWTGAISELSLLLEVADAVDWRRLPQAPKQAVHVRAAPAPLPSDAAASSAALRIQEALTQAEAIEGGQRGEFWMEVAAACEPLMKELATRSDAGPAAAYLRLALEKYRLALAEQRRGQLLAAIKAAHDRVPTESNLETINQEMERIGARRSDDESVRAAAAALDQFLEQTRRERLVSAVTQARARLAQGQDPDSVWKDLEKSGATQAREEEVKLAVQAFQQDAARLKEKRLVQVIQTAEQRARGGEIAAVVIAEIEQLTGKETPGTAVQAALRSLESVRNDQERQLLASMPEYEAALRRGQPVSEIASRMRKQGAQYSRAPAVKAMFERLESEAGVKRFADEMLDRMERTTSDQDCRQAYLEILEYQRRYPASAQHPTLSLCENMLAKRLREKGIPPPALPPPPGSAPPVVIASAPKIPAPTAPPPAVAQKKAEEASTPSKPAAEPAPEKKPTPSAITAKPLSAPMPLLRPASVPPPAGGAGASSMTAATSPEAPAAIQSAASPAAIKAMLSDAALFKRDSIPGALDIGGYRLCSIGNGLNAGILIEAVMARHGKPDAEQQQTREGKIVRYLHYGGRAVILISNDMKTVAQALIRKDLIEE